jgi:hypothetical protein
MLKNLKYFFAIIFGVIVICAIIYPPFFVGKKRFILHIENNTAKLSLNDDLILTITNIPDGVSNDNEHFVIKSGDSKMGTIGWDSVDLGFLDEHLMLKINQKSFWINGGNFRDENNVVKKVISYNSK